MTRTTLLLLPLMLLACGCTGGAAGDPSDDVGAREAKSRHGSDFDVEIAQAAEIGEGLVGKPDEIVVVERGRGYDGSGAPRGGELRARVDGEEREIPLPLEHTDVKGRITLHVASVTVRQRYGNPFREKIEAVYVFPLPQNAAVTDFVMQIGERRIRGIIREREEARRIYLAARREGYVASLLTQERPNIFTQSVANIEPGKRIDVEIAYFNTLRYRDGEYEFVFPMVVGPRFNPPGSTDGVGAVPRGGTGTSGQATEVPYLRPGEISAHAISLAVEIDAGVRIGEPESPSHGIDVRRAGDQTVRVSLKEVDRIPNRDFVLRYRVAKDEAYGALKTFRDDRGGYFTLMLQPPATLDDLPRQAREMIFVVDCSGSMEGEPLAACKRAMRRCLERLGPNDTFQVIRFSDTASAMGRRPVRATAANVNRGRRYVSDLRSDGGTMMIRGIRAALDAPRDSERYRIVSFMTDGYIGNEREILGEVRARVGEARIFSFGVGNSVNRYLLERMAQAGRGVAAYVSTDESSGRAVDGLYRRIERPAMTDIEIDWGAMEVHETYPHPMTDLFVGSPVVVAGRFRGEGRTVVKVKGKVGGRPTEMAVAVDLDAGDATHEALAKLWARARIAGLSDRMTHETGVPGLADEVRDTALEFGLVSRFTAFVAVDSTRRTEGGHGTTVPVPVPVPEGTRYETTVR